MEMDAIILEGSHLSVYLTEKSWAHYPHHRPLIKCLKGCEISNLCPSFWKCLLKWVLTVTGWTGNISIVSGIDRGCMREGIVSNIVSIIQLLFTTSACPASQPSREKQGIEREKLARTHIDILHLKPPVNPVCQSVGTWPARLAGSQQQRNKSWSYNNASVDLLLFRDRRWMVPLF